MIETFFINILSMSTIASIVFLIILFIRKCIKNKVNYENIILLWIIFILVLIIPLNFQSRLSIKNFINLDKSYELISSQKINNEIIYEGDFEIKNTDYEKANMMETTSYIWITGVFLLIFIDYLVYKNLNLKNSYDIQDDVLEECKKELGIKKDIKLVVQNKIKMPSLYGIFNTKILITEEILNFSYKEQKCILIHELNHYKKRHHIFYLLFNLIERIHWFNPIVKIAFKIIKQDLEIITDNSVLKSDIAFKEYCNTILKITKLYGLEESKMPSICSGKKDIERRIIHMKNNYVKNSIFIIVVAMSILSLVTISLASEKVVDNDNKEIITEIFNEIDNQISETEKVKYIVPVEYTIVSSRFGKRIHPITKEEKFHTGIDLVAKEGTKVKAAADGVVIAASYDNQKGNYVEIKHIDGSVSSYHHGLEILVEVGQNVKCAEEIMTVGKTGNATGAHLHFEVRNKNNEYMDVNMLVD